MIVIDKTTVCLSTDEDQVTGAAADATSRATKETAVTSPSGNYTGRDNALGQAVSGTVSIINGTHMNLEVGHPAHIKCPGEPYTLSSTGAVTLPTAGTAGDCVHDALSAHGGSIESIFYNSSADAIHVDVTVLYFISVKMTLTACC